MLSAAFIANCRELATIIAPEISQPLYLMDHPQHLPVAANCGGYAVRGTCSELKEVLKETGEWFGPGPQIVLCDGDNPGTFIHELAHCLPFTPRRDTLDIPAVRKLRLSSLKRFAAEPVIPVDSAKWEPDHGMDFIRVVLNLVWRANNAGFPVQLGYIAVAGAEYGLSDPWHYAVALGDEPKRMQHATFAEILASDPPQQFTDLFAKDTQ